jgi:hypothetical protein
MCLSASFLTLLAKLGCLAIRMENCNYTLVYEHSTANFMDMSLLFVQRLFI